MIYLYVDKNTIKLISLSKTLLGQYNISFFNKKHANNLLVKGQITNVDIVASAIKEALTGANPSEINDKEVTLILPQNSFDFARYDIPVDISQSAVIPFITDKLRADINFNLDKSHFDFLINTQDKDSVVLIYGLKGNALEKIQETLSLLQLQLKAIYPDTVCYYKLFDKTLRSEKKENILYTYLTDSEGFGYVYDYLGLLKVNRYELTEYSKTGLKETVDKISTEYKLNRLILSGNTIHLRQDLFTKEVGVWTNLLDKIIQNFYQQYVKLLIPDESSKLNILHYDVCLGCFIFTQENTTFSLLKKKASNIDKEISRTYKSSNGSGIKSRFLNHRTMLSFIFSAFFTLTVVFVGLKLTSIKIPSFKFPFNPPSPTQVPTQIPTQIPTPTPGIIKENIKIKVLNGGGVAGKASEFKELLIDKGYSEVLTDNADNFNYQKTEIAIKKDKKQEADLVINDLAGDIKITKTTDLDDKESADLVITIGKDFE